MMSPRLPANPRSIFPLVLSLLILAFSTACSGSGGPAEVLSSANRKFFSENDYSGALALYERVLQWKGEPAPTDAQRFEAALNALRCRIFTGQTQGVKAELDKIGEAFGNKLTYKNYCTVIGDLEKRKELKAAIDVLIEAGKKFPDYKERFQQEAKKLERLGLSNEDLERLKTLGYL